MERPPASANADAGQGERVTAGDTLFSSGPLGLGIAKKGTATTNYTRDNGGNLISKRGGPTRCITYSTGWARWWPWVDALSQPGGVLHLRSPTGAPCRPTGRRRRRTPSATPVATSTPTLGSPSSGRGTTTRTSGVGPTRTLRPRGQRLCRRKSGQFRRPQWTLIRPNHRCFQHRKGNGDELLARIGRIIPGESRRRMQVVRRRSLNDLRELYADLKDGRVEDTDLLDDLAGALAGTIGTGGCLGAASIPTAGAAGVAGAGVCALLAASVSAAVSINVERQRVGK